MTSTDRHASHDSPFRTGQHVPLTSSRHPPLTSVATGGMESRTDLDFHYAGDAVDGSNGFIGSPNGTASPRNPYSPSLLPSLSRQSTAEGRASPGEIQMQSFSEGLPPPPPVSHSWKRIDRWAEDNYAELYDNLSEGCSHNDVNELEVELDCSLPLEVRESLQIHDGQERGGLPTGLVFGCMLLDCEEIAQEWQNWRRVSEEFFTRQTYQPPQLPLRAFAGASSSSSPPPAVPGQNNPQLWKQNLLAKQDSQPPNAVQKAYAHPGWIPVARDWGGNNLAIDLAPGPTGKWGQVIIIGRDYDCKYVVARSWAAFLASFADDLASDRVSVDEETGELKLLEFKPRQNIEPPYLEILRWRADQKYGRRKPRRKPAGGLNINSNVPPAHSYYNNNSSSPYDSPVSTDSERGRSSVRFLPKAAASGGMSSPRPHLSSPLARVSEEAPGPVRVHTLDSDSPIRPLSRASTAGSKGPTEKLVPIDSPRVMDFESDDLSLQKVDLDGVGEKEKGRDRERNKENLGHEPMVPSGLRTVET